jgi:predicted amidophosphoribosyltransferase
VLLDLLLPRQCAVCGRVGEHLCAACRAALPPLTPPLCARCGAPVAWPVERCSECAGRRLAFTRARAAVPYDGDVRRLVRIWKERGIRSLAEAAAAVVAERVARPDVDVVTFVPADVWRTRARGHHPAERLARSLAKRWELPCTRLLEPVGTWRQRGGSRAERGANPSFRATGEAPPAAVLVDDVYTTGATANAAARALCGRVEVVSFARAILRG